MADYLDIYKLRSDSDLQDRTAVACIKKAQSLIDAGALTDNAKAWVNSTLADPRSEALRILNYALAANSDASVETIKGVGDSTLQANIDAAVDALIA